MHFVSCSRLNNDRGAFAGFGLDGANLKADDSGNKALYGKPITNSEIVEGHADTPASAQPLVAKLNEGTSH
jgi:lipid-binding SYLF domain-containing protein